MAVSCQCVCVCVCVHRYTKRWTLENGTKIGMKKGEVSASWWNSAQRYRKRKCKVESGMATIVVPLTENILWSNRHLGYIINCLSSNVQVKYHCSHITDEFPLTSLKCQ